MDVSAPGLAPSGRYLLHPVCPDRQHVVGSTGSSPWLTKYNPHLSDVLDKMIPVLLTDMSSVCE